jgi:hypothetical protein
MVLKTFYVPPLSCTSCWCQSATGTFYNLNIMHSPAEIIRFYQEVLFRTQNLGQHFLDISKKNDVNQALVSLINDNY